MLEDDYLRNTRALRRTICHQGSSELISKVTDGILEEVIAWQNRGIDDVYPIMYLDCIHVKARDNHVIINKAVYLSIGVNMEGKKELLGIWIGKNEGSKLGMQVVTELKNRGVEQILCYLC